MAYCYDDGLRTYSLEQGTLLHLLQSAQQTVCLPHLLCVVILVTIPRETPETLGRNMRLNHKEKMVYYLV